jgi:hypothetical protein
MNFKTLPLLALILLLSAGPIHAQKEKKPHPKPMTPQEEDELRAKYPILPPHPSFYIQPITETPGSFSLLLSDENNRSVAGSFRTAQLNIFEAILAESLMFAQSDEEIGKTTRFADKNERSFIVDVQKNTRGSTLYITLSYLSSKITIDAGSIMRGDKREHKLLAKDLLAALREIREKS